jgi:hypothetical protein
LLRVSHIICAVQRLRLWRMPDQAHLDLIEAPDKEEHHMRARGRHEHAPQYLTMHGVSTVYFVVPVPVFPVLINLYFPSLFTVFQLSVVCVSTKQPSTKVFPFIFVHRGVALFKSAMIPHQMRDADMYASRNNKFVFIDIWHVIVSFIHFRESFAFVTQLFLDLPTYCCHEITSMVALANARAIFLVCMPVWCVTEV